MTLTGTSPSGERVAYPASGAQAAAGSEGTISIKNGDVTTTYRAPVVQTAAADATVLLKLLPRSDGTLTGTWSYFADPITQRRACRDADMALAAQGHLLRRRMALHLGRRALYPQQLRWVAER